MKRKLSIKTLLLAIAVTAAASGCAETVRVSRGTQIPPEHRGVSSAEVTETFTRFVRGEHVSIAATLIDFSYVRAITLERGRSRDQERDAYLRYVRRQTTFYVNLVLHGRDDCRAVDRRARRDDDDADGDEGERDDADVLGMDGWRFTLRSSTGREREPSEVEAGATQLAPSGGCLVQGYVHFPGSISPRVEWIELEAASGERGRMRTKVRWAFEQWTPPRRRERSPEDRPPASQRPSDESQDEPQPEGVTEQGEEETPPDPTSTSDTFGD